MILKEKLSFVKTKIKQAQKRSNFNNKVEIVGVTKTQPFNTIVESYKLGIRSVGENRVQEAEGKFKSFKKMPGLKKRFIGHLQSNKTKKCVLLFDTIDTVHSLRLLKKLSTEGQKINKTITVLLEINTSGEEQKHGFFLNQKDEVIQCFEERNIKIEGLMTMAPYTKDSGLIRSCFSQLRELKNELNRLISGEKMKELSMGMSGDYEIAIEEGATLIRLGTVLFGSRGG